MIATISKDFAFSASHQLAGLTGGHPCGRLHGHNYLVRATITGEVDSVGFVVDYGELKPFATYIDTTLDHRHLNDVLTTNPTAEYLAVWLLQFLGDAVEPWREHIHRISVGVSETPKTWATVEAEFAR